MTIGPGPLGTVVAKIMGPFDSYKPMSHCWEGKNLSEKTYY